MLETTKYIPFYISAPDTYNQSIRSRMINTMKIEFEDTNKYHLAKIIKYAIGNCPNLHHLHIYNGDRGDYYIYILYSNGSKYPTNNTTIDPHERSIDVLKYAELEGNLYYKVVLDSLEAHVPELECICYNGLQDLVFYNSNTILNNDNPNYPSVDSTQFTIDLTPFNDLKFFFFDIYATFKDEKLFSHTVICLQYPDEEQKYYSITWALKEYFDLYDMDPMYRIDQLSDLSHVADELNYCVVMINFLKSLENIVIFYDDPGIINNCHNYHHFLFTH